MSAMYRAMLYGINYLQVDRGYRPLGAGVLLWMPRRARTEA